ncbi:MAG: flagellar basal body P-ring formation chaperone FlgA [Pseudomonadota bacterium]
MARGDSVVAAGTIRSQQIIRAADVQLVEDEIAGALGHVDLAIGLEARINIYAGRPVRAGDLGPPAIVDRNEIVTLRYQAGGLLILTEGRSLDRGASGERVRVQNLSSRSSVTGRVIGPGLIEVGP